MLASITSHRPAVRTLRRGLTVPVAVALIAAALSGATADVAAAAGPLVPCESVATGRFNCTFYPRATEVLNSKGAKVGTLHRGVNWVICQRTGANRSNGAFYNRNWAFTQSDQGPMGWVNAVWARGGANDGAFRYVPRCPPGSLSPPQTLPNPWV